MFGPPTNLFLFHVFPCHSAGKVLPPQQNPKLRRSPAGKEPLWVSRRGVVSELLFSGWFYSAWGGGGRIPLTLVSWMGASVCCSGLSRIPLRVLLHTRCLLLVNVCAPSHAQNQSSIADPYFDQSTFTTWPGKSLSLPIHLSHERKHLKLCLQVVYQWKYQFQDKGQKSWLREQKSPRNISELLHSLSSGSNNVCMTNVNMILKLYTEMQFKAYLDSLVQHFLWMKFTECVFLCSPGELNACVCSSTAASPSFHFQYCLW